jgi:hypothetical protein
MKCDCGKSVKGRHTCGDVECIAVFFIGREHVDALKAKAVSEHLMKVEAEREQEAKARAEWKKRAGV